MKIQQKTNSVQCRHDWELLIKCHSYETKDSTKSTENWCVDGIINFEEPFKGLEELRFNPVSYSAKTNYVSAKSAKLRYSNSAVTLIKQSVKTKSLY